MSPQDPGVVERGENQAVVQGGERQSPTLRPCPPLQVLLQTTDLTHHKDGMNPSKHFFPHKNY